MGRRYFGTDGIRGRVGEDPMTVDFALRLASAAAHALAPQGGTVLIGKDTRVSGYMFESALEAGFVASGVDVLLTGPLPTPAIAYLTKKSGADFGIGFWLMLLGSVAVLVGAILLFRADAST